MEFSEFYTRLLAESSSVLTLQKFDRRIAELEQEMMRLESCVCHARRYRIGAATAGPLHPEAQ